MQGSSIMKIVSTKIISSGSQAQDNYTINFLNFLLAEDLAMDWITNNLYWTDTLNRRLEVLDIDLEYKTELLRTDAHSAPKAIVVDPSTRYMKYYYYSVNVLS